MKNRKPKEGGRKMKQSTIKVMSVLLLTLLFVMAFAAITPAVAQESGTTVAQRSNAEPATDDATDDAVEEGVPEVEPLKPVVVSSEEAADTVAKLIWFAITFMSGFVVLIGIVILIILGFKMMTSSSPEKAQAAKAQFGRVLIGLAIIALAGVAVSTVVFVVTKPLGG
jgi:hypothetical protein